MNKLIFVYNAKSDILNSVFDFAHKIISPKTYACNLCKLTHGAFSEKESWKVFKVESDIALEFLHIDEFEQKYNSSHPYPVILKIEDSALSVYMDTEELNEINSTEELIEILKRNLVKTKYDS